MLDANELRNITISILSPHTTVGAGSVVTKSFEEGYCVIAGNPAKVIKYLEKNI